MDGNSDDLMLGNGRGRNTQIRRPMQSKCGIVTKITADSTTGKWERAAYVRGRMSLDSATAARVNLRRNKAPLGVTRFFVGDAAMPTLAVVAAANFVTDDR
jgi:hypothetical protein